MLGCAVLSVGAVEATVASVAGGQAPAAGVERHAGMEGVVYGFFDDRTGDRIGRLSIGHVGIEYQRQGFLRVAWKPLVVLDEVMLEIAPGAHWPDAGRQIIDALGRGRSREAVVRRLHLRVGGEPAVDLTAALAQLRADGALLLAEADAGGTARPAKCFWLAGPQAGTLTPPDGPLSAAALSLYVKPTTTP